MRYRIRLDMDGVLVDFPSAKVRAMSEEDKENKVFQNAQFWVDLPMKDDAKELVEFVKDNFDEVEILSSPGHNDNLEVKRGKLIWLENHIGNIESTLDNDKYKYAEPDIILIDDRERFTVPFEREGGKTVLHTDTATTIKELQQFI